MKGGKLRAMACGRFHGDAARAARIKHQTQRIGPGLDRRLRVPMLVIPQILTFTSTPH